MGNSEYLTNTTHTNIVRSLMNNSTAERLPKTWFMMMKKKAPTLKGKKMF